MLPCWRILFIVVKTGWQITIFNMTKTCENIRKCWLHVLWDLFFLCMLFCEDLCPTFLDNLSKVDNDERKKILLDKKSIHFLCIRTLPPIKLLCIFFHKQQQCLGFTYEKYFKQILAPVLYIGLKKNYHCTATM